MKKTISLITILTLVMSLSACGGNVKKAHLKGYDEPLNELLEDACKEYCNEAEADEDWGIEAKYNIEWSDGWEHKDAPDEDDVGKGKEAVTCKITFTWESDGESEDEEYIFFLAHDKGEKELNVKGAIFVDGDYSNELSADDAEEYLEDIIDGNF